jgi:ribosomal protein L24E
MVSYNVSVCGDDLYKGTLIYIVHSEGYIN